MSFLVHDNRKESTRLNNYTIKNIYDSSRWEDIDTKLRDLLIEKKSPIRVTYIDFPKDKYFEHFSHQINCLKDRNKKNDLFILEI